MTLFPAPRIRLAAPFFVLLFAAFASSAFAQFDRPEPGPQVNAPPPAEPLPYGRVHVLCVGWNDYPLSQSMYRNLNFAVADAQALGALLSSRFGYSVEVLPPTHASKAALYDKLDTYKTLASNDVFIFFYAGHGETVRASRDGIDGAQIGYIVPPSANLDSHYTEALRIEGARREKGRVQFLADHPAVDGAPPAIPPELADDPKLIDAAARNQVVTVPVFNAECIPTEELRAKVLAIPAKHVLLILDSCFSGFAAIESRSRDSAPPPADSDLDYYDLLKESSQYVLTAGTATQKALEGQGARGAGDAALPASEQHGVFTAALLDALRSDADVLSASRVHAQVRTTVMEAVRNVRHPAERMVPQARTFGSGGGEFAFLRDPSEKWRAKVAQDRRVDAARPVTKRAARGRRDARERSKDDAALHLLIGVGRATRIVAGEANAPGPEDQRWSEWFRHSDYLASRGDPEGMAALYYAYAFGLGVHPDRAAAYRWAQEASDTGDATGRATLVHALRRGTGVVRSELVANRLAADQKNQAAAASGGVILAQSMQQGNATGIVAGGFTLIGGLSNLLTDTVDKAVADMLQAHARLEKAIVLPDGPTRRAEMQGSLETLKAVSYDIKKYAEQRPDLDLFKTLGPRVAGRLGIAAMKLQEAASKDSPSRRVDLAESVDQLTALYMTTRASTK